MADGAHKPRPSRWAASSATPRRRDDADLHKEANRNTCTTAARHSRYEDANAPRPAGRNDREFVFSRPKSALDTPEVTTAISRLTGLIHGGRQGHGAGRLDGAGKGSQWLVESLVKEVVVYEDRLK